MAGAPDFVGRFFCSSEGLLAPFTAELDECVAHSFPEFVGGSAAARLVLRPDELTGLGVALADGVRLRKETAVALYYGDVVSTEPPGEFALALSSFRRAHQSHHPFIDATRSCTGHFARPLNAAMFNHTCHGETVHLREWHGCALPCAIAYAPAGSPAGGRLLWDYDGGLRTSAKAFTVGSRDAAALQALGVDMVPCACRGALACPRSRWFRVYPRS